MASVTIVFAALAAALGGLSVCPTPNGPSTNPVEPQAPPDAFRLWPGNAPLARGQSEHDIPTLTPYLPDKPCGSAVVVCPGGGYWMLAGHEGKDYALFLNSLGIAAFVLEYRLGQFGYRHPAMLLDAARALRTVRHRAQEWGVDPGRIGVMGSSAGGHLASTLMTHYDAGDPNAGDPIDRVSSRPDFGILCYAVISLVDYGHRGSADNLLGADAPEAKRRELSNDLSVTKDTPPCFLWHTAEDDAVPVENSIAYAMALRKAKVPFELHVFEKGGHGMGLADQPPFAKAHPWAKDLAHWLRGRGLAG